MSASRLLAGLTLSLALVACQNEPKPTGNSETSNEASEKPRCIDPVIKIFDNYNTLEVKNGGQAPSFDTTKFKTPKVRYCLVRIETYHWNDRKGAAPGTLGLKDSTGANVAPGPWAATGAPGQFGVPNASWAADVPTSPPVILDGEYKVSDSSPLTWSGNATSGKAFAKVYVKEYLEP